MNARAALGVGLAFGGLGLGLWAAWVASANHRLARELDRRQRACDALEVWNDHLRFEVLTAEEAILSGVVEEADAAVSDHGGEL